MYLPLTEYMTFKTIFNYLQVTYLGKELFKYVSEEVPVPPEPCSTPQQQQPCLPGTCGTGVPKPTGKVLLLFPPIW